MTAPSTFRLDGDVAVVTGGYGVIGFTLANALMRAGARVALVARSRERVEQAAELLRAQGGDVLAVVGDVLHEGQLRSALSTIVERWGQVDTLVNAAGGNVSRARSDSIPIFDVPLDALDDVLRLNLHGTIIPSLVFGGHMAGRRRGSIVTISSMASARSLSGVMGYSVAKAGIESFTRWMGVELARKYGDGVRVNAIAPGFFLSEQNRAVLVAPDGSLTPRAQAIVAHTPMGRFGRPEELSGAVVWLASGAASFVTGAVIPVDGGFGAFGGV